MSDLKQNKATYTLFNRVQLIKNGGEYFQLLGALIARAKYTIHLQVYIFDDDTTGRNVTDALKAAAARGVQVFFIADGYATRDLSNDFLKELKSSGVHFRKFEPLLKNRYFYFGRRLHHKVFVADASYALVTGMNITDRYNDLPGRPGWKDMALYVEGEAAMVLEDVCCGVWNKSYGSLITAKPATQHIRVKILEKLNIEEPVSVRVRINDWVKGKNEVWKSYFDMLNQSTESITIMCSYFLPGWVYRKQMLAAIKRGVKIKVVLAGKSDIVLSKLAERYLYNWMLRNGFEIYEYQENILHAKVAVEDERRVTIGSFNVNNISALASIELNLDVRNKPFAKIVKQHIEQTTEDNCVQITRENYQTTTNFFKRLKYRCAYELVKVMLYLVTFYYKREKF